MKKSVLCKLGIHKWNKATFMDHGIHSNILDYKQNCIRCGKTITWVQPKGSKKKYYPISWSKRRSWIFWVFFIIIIFFFIYRIFM